MSRYVLQDYASGAYIGSSTTGAPTAVVLESAAVVFDERDNMPLKLRFYRAVTGMDLGIKRL